MFRVRGSRGKHDTDPVSPVSPATLTPFSYYQPGFRSAYFDMQPGRHANEGEGEESADPYTSMFILLEGEVSVILDDEPHPLTEGNMMIVPPNVRHEIINTGEVNARGFLMMFGEGA